MGRKSAPHVAFGTAIRELREERGLSQEQLGYDGGIDRSYMGRVERGEVNASLQKILQIADALDLPPSALFERFERCAIRR